MNVLRTRRHRSAHAPRGFVLIAVLAVLVILSILGATIGVITQRLRDEQLLRQRQLREEIAMASTRATVIYLLNSQRMTFGGLTVDSQVVLKAEELREQQAGETPVSYWPVGNELALDGTAFEGLNGTRFALQDDRGRLAVNWTSPVLLENFLTAGQQPARPIGSLVNLLQDYQDPDDLYRLNSAERQQYLRENLPPPTNRTLVTPQELRRVMGWDKALAPISDSDLNDALSVGRGVVINVNTAPASVLRTLPGVDRSMADRVVAARSLTPFVHIIEFYTLLGLSPVDEDFLSLYPLDSGTLKLWPAEGGTVQVLHWTLTPFDEGGRPWREDYEFILPGDERTTEGSARPVEAKVFAQPDAAPRQ